MRDRRRPLLVLGAMFARTTRALPPTLIRLPIVRKRLADGLATSGTKG
ncbi:hypothetical protein [Streptomyces kaempferi]